MTSAIECSIGVCVVKNEVELCAIARVRAPLANYELFSYILAQWRL